MEKLLIFPYNGNAMEAVDCIGDQYELIGFIDDTPEKHGSTAWGVDVFDRTALTKYKEAKVLAVPGSAVSYKKRQDHIASLGIPDSRMATVIHLDASVGQNVRVGMNCLIMAGVVITSNAVINDHVCILPNTVIHHDCLVNDYTLIGSNVVIAGGSTIGRNCYIGSGSNIINGIVVGDYSLIGLGSNVIRSVGENKKVAGNPAREINN